MLNFFFKRTCNTFELCSTMFIASSLASNEISLIGAFGLMFVTMVISTIGEVYLSEKK